MSKAIETFKSLVLKHKRLLIEVGIVFAIVLSLSILSLVTLFHISPSDTRELLGEYTVNVSILLESLICSSVMIIGSNMLFITVHPGSPDRPKELFKSRVIIYGILMVLGLIANVVLNTIIYVYLGWGKGWTFFLGTFITLIYVYFIFKLYYMDEVNNPHMFWEIVRFALVGVVAAVFDFSTLNLVRFKVLGGVSNATIVTLVSVTCGFLVGVTVNYLCSVYMVYKSKTGIAKSKTTKGMLLFVGLSAVGLFIGIGLEALLYDVIKMAYVAVFIIRTLVVLVWNYVSRKILIFK